MVGIKRLTTTLAMAGCFALLSGKVVTGHVRTGKTPMADIIVTDGLHFTYTKSDGSYKLDAPEDAKFVYLITPKGYIADYSSGVPQFYQRIGEARKSHDFELYPMKGNSDKTLMIASSDPQLDTDHDVGRFFNETLTDMQQVLKDYADRQQAMFMAGDLTWDVYGKNKTIKQYAQKLGIPLYPVIGNHDYDKYAAPGSGANYAAPYEDDFGPTYYAFQFGDTYYVVLNDIKFEGHKRYTYSIQQGHQMEWLKTLLNVVFQQDNNVFIVAHAPICRPGGTELLIDGAEELKTMLVRKPFRASFFTGHTHINDVTYVGNDIWEYNLGTMCGYWWTSNYSGDGTPNGYKLILADGKEWQQVYKSTGWPLEKQFQIYKPGQIAERPNAVCCKIWNYDSRWQLRWYEDGKLMGGMNQFYSFAPEYLQFLDGRLATADYTPIRSNHFFSCKPSRSAKTIKIEAVDPYGNVYKDSVLLK